MISYPLSSFRVPGLGDLSIFIILVFGGKGKIFCCVCGGQLGDGVTDIVIGGRVEVLHTVQEPARLDHVAVFIGVLGRDNGWRVFVAHHSLCNLLIQSILRRVVIGV